MLSRPGKFPAVPRFSRVDGRSQRRSLRSARRHQSRPLFSGVGPADASGTIERLRCRKSVCLQPFIIQGAHRVPGTCVIGLQWGDEAKGKIVDLLTREHDIVVRYQGGANAGHTVVVGDQIYKLSLLPSGILTPGVTCVIAGGVVFNPANAIEELDELGDPRRRGLRQPEAQRSGPRDLPLALRRRPGARHEHVRRREHRHDQPRHRALLPRQGRPLARHAAGRPVPADVPRTRRAHRRAPRIASSRRCIPASEFKPLDAAAIYEQYTALRRAAEAVRRRHDRVSAHRGRERASGCCSKAPRGAARRRPRHLSVRHQQQQLGRRHRRAAPACRAGTSTTSSAS